jgi:hypothetical protein
MAFGSIRPFTPPPLVNPIADAPGVAEAAMPGVLAQALPRKHGALHGILGFLQEALTGIPTAEHRQAAENRQLDLAARKGLLAQQLEQDAAARTREAGQAQWLQRQEYEAAHRPEPPAITLARAAGIQEGTPEWRLALTAAIPGYEYTAPVIQARANAQKEVAGYRADRSAGLRATPTYAQAHPRPRAAPRSPKPPAGFILN